MSVATPTPSRIASISRNKGVPEVELVVGDAQVGAFVFFLWPSDGKTPQKVPPDGDTLATFSLNPPVTAAALLDKRFLTWQGFVGAPAAGPQLFSVTVNIKQDGGDVPDGPFVQTGTFQDATFIHDGIQFVLID
jgi:hypothetical protein